MASSVAAARIACTSPPFIEQATASELNDWLAYTDPHLILLAGTSSAPRAASTLRRCTESETIVFQPAGRTPTTGPQLLNDVQFVLAPTLHALEGLPEYEQEVFDTDEPIYVLSNLLELDVDTTTLSTTLVGHTEYSKPFTHEQLHGDYRHISTQLPADYRREWNDLTIIGSGSDAGHAGTPLTTLQCRTDGRVLTEQLQPTRLGLQALNGVGNTRAQHLREAGLTERSDVADTALSTLTDVQGLGRATAERIQKSAQAIARSEIIRESKETLPHGEPVYIDIETDGLSPTIIWLIGVLDGPAQDGEYLSFIQTDPDVPGQAIEDFMLWYMANASHRPLVAYNGWKFDFQVIHDHIIEYCPQYEDHWQRTYRFDPYQWAVKDGNAIFPGRTNKLEDVAAALGYERTETGLTGAAVARAYQQWMRDRSPATEPDWEQFKAYCEDDVRALATIYEALEASSRIISTESHSRDIDESTTQGTLSDW